MIIQVLPSLKKSKSRPWQKFFHQKRISWLLTSKIQEIPPGFSVGYLDVLIWQMVISQTIHRTRIYRISTYNLRHKSMVNVGKYSIHGSYGFHSSLKSETSSKRSFKKSNVIIYFDFAYFQWLWLLLSGSVSIVTDESWPTTFSSNDFSSAS